VLILSEAGFPYMLRYVIWTNLKVAPKKMTKIPSSEEISKSVNFAQFFAFIFKLLALCAASRPTELL
jgi:hypothetical protein